MDEDFSVLITLPHIRDPGPQGYFFIIQNLHVVRRYFPMIFASDILEECVEVLLKADIVLHMAQSSLVSSRFSVSSIRANYDGGGKG